MKILNLLYFFFIFRKFPQSEKIDNSEDRMNQFTIGRIRGFETRRFAICFNFISFSENLRNAEKLVFLSTE